MSLGFYSAIFTIISNPKLLNKSSMSSLNQSLQSICTICKVFKIFVFAIDFAICSKHFIDITFVLDCLPCQNSKTSSEKWIDSSSRKRGDSLISQFVKVSLLVFRAPSIIDLNQASSNFNPEKLTSSVTCRSECRNASLKLFTWGYLSEDEERLKMFIQFGMRSSIKYLISFLNATEHLSKLLIDTSLYTIHISAKPTY